MAGFVQNFQNIWRVEELRNRIGYTILLLVAYRFGAFVTLPGLDPAKLNSNLDNNSVLGLLNVFVGGAFEQAGIFALGIMPYITVSILIQLFGVVLPTFAKLQREGDEGRRKISQITRYGTIVITAFQAWGYVQYLKGTFPQAILDNTWLFTISTMFVLTAGTMFVLWLGEQINDRGIGNGISLIIMTGILAGLPQAFSSEVSAKGNLFIIVVELAILLLIVAAIVYLTVGTRKIPVQYAKRVVGRKVVEDKTQYLPLKITAAGVMPIIFAQSIMFIPTTLAAFFPNSATWTSIGLFFGDISSWNYAIIFFILIVFFTYFYTAIAVNPRDMADNMKKSGGFIPGIKPGSDTSDFIDNILTRVTLPGALFLGLVAVLPTICIKLFNMDQNWAQFFGGTSLLIMVQVMLDTLQQVESHLLTRNYDGFMRSGKLRGRR
jgi:preprotein translocase subunit SecY